MKNLLARLARDDQGQDLIEYVLIGSFVSLAAAVTAVTLGTNLMNWYAAVAAWVLAAIGLVPVIP